MTMQGVSYDDIDEVIGIVNEGYNKRRQDEYKEKRTNGAIFMIDRAIERSINEEDWKIEQEKRLEVMDSESRKKMKTTIIAVLIGATLVAPFAFKGGKAIVEKYEHWTSVNSAVAAQKTEIMSNLLHKGLAYIDDEIVINPNGVNPFTVKNNSVEHYKTLKVSDYIDVYLYKLCLPTEEFNDFIRSLTYTDFNGNICNYLNFEQYLNINGFPNEKTFDNYGKEGAYQREVQKEQAENKGKGGK